MRRRIVRHAAAVLTCAMAASFHADTAAQEFTGKPIRIVIGFAAGGGHDLVARPLAPKYPGSVVIPLAITSSTSSGVAPAFVSRR
jgi:tripartite-type tricarboxylate transporter receptor subunit TctC